MKISVILPIHNVELKVRDCIESIQKQTMQDIEIICVDSGSTDNTVVIIQNLSESDKRIKLFRFEKQKYVNQINQGVSEAKGEYISIIDAKEKITETMFQDMYEIAINNDLDWVRADFCENWGDDTKDKKAEREILEQKDDYYKVLNPEFDKKTIANSLYKPFNGLYKRSFLLENSITNIESSEIDFFAIGFDLRTIYFAERVMFLSTPYYSCRGNRYSSFQNDAFYADKKWGIEKEFIDNNEDLYNKFIELFHSRKLSYMHEIYKELDSYNKVAFLEKIRSQFADTINRNEIDFMLLRKEDFVFLNSFMNQNPRITVVLPVYNNSETLRKTIESIQKQTYPFWKMLIILEYGSDDDSGIIAQELSDTDKRIQVIRNERKLGLADSLNLGIMLSDTEFIARIDADDCSMPERFEKQLKVMDQRPDVIVCGTWQQHYGVSTWIHRAPEDSQKIRANMIFEVDNCHSTLLLRRSGFINNQLLYDRSYPQEDFELWTRALEFGEFTNIPEILGDYFESGKSISIKKRAEIKKYGGIVTANALKRFLDIDLTEEQKQYISYFYMPFNRNNKIEFRNQRKDLSKLIRKIAKANEKIEYCDNKRMLDALFAVWCKAVYSEEHYHDAPYNFRNVKEIFLYKPYLYCYNKIIINFPGIKSVYRKVKHLFHM